MSIDYKNIYPPRQPRNFFSNGQALQATFGYIFLIVLTSLMGWCAVGNEPLPRPHLVFDKQGIYEYTQKQFQADADRYFTMMSQRGAK